MISEPSTVVLQFQLQKPWEFCSCKSCKEVICFRMSLTLLTRIHPQSLSKFNSKSPWKMDENGWLEDDPFLLGPFCKFTAGLSQFFTFRGEISKWMIFSRGVISKGPLWKAPMGWWMIGCVTVFAFFSRKV